MGVGKGISLIRGRTIRRARFPNGSFASRSLFVVFSRTSNDFSRDTLAGPMPPIRRIGKRASPRERRRGRPWSRKLGEEAGRGNFERETFSEARINSTHSSLFLRFPPHPPRLSHTNTLHAHASEPPSFLVNLPSPHHEGLRGKRERKNERWGGMTDAQGSRQSACNDTKKMPRDRGTLAAGYRMLAEGTEGNQTIKWTVDPGCGQGSETRGPSRVP